METMTAHMETISKISDIILSPPHGCKVVTKQRKFPVDYIKFGSIFTEKDELQLPQCVIRMKILGNDSMRPNHLEASSNLKFQI